MNILLIGSGGREHALAWAIKKSTDVENLYCIPGNPGIYSLAIKVDMDLYDYSRVSNFCKTNSIDLVVVGPEQPLADGIADELRNKGINVFGPNKSAAILESSKSYAKEFMKKYNIPTAQFQSFSQAQAESARDYIDSLNHPVVIKADGLAAGKGVVISETKDESHKTLDLMFSGLFGESGKKVVIEEFLEGEEASILALTDGNNYLTLAPSQDHKRIFEDDKGPNTGGMGAYAPAPLINNDIQAKIKNKILTPAIKGIKNEGATFIGCLYAGLMISKGEPYVIEFNVRFGDPEAQAVLPLVDGDLARTLFSAAKGKLDNSKIKSVDNGFACCVILSSDGYPSEYKKGFVITGIEEAEKRGAIVFQAGTASKDKQIVNAGGRVLGVTGIGKSLKEAIDNAYRAADLIHFQNKYFRRDIGYKGLKYE